MSNSLFNEFEPVSAKQWKQKIQFDLKGADYNDTLVWTSDEGIPVKPFYHADDLNSTTKITTGQFKICETIFVSNSEDANKKAISAINGGAESIKFIIPSTNIDLSSLLSNINLDKIPIHFKLHFVSPEYIEQIYNLTTNTKVYIHNDIIGDLAKKGNWYNNLKDDFLAFHQSVIVSKSFSINAELYQNSGANIVQQLAYAMAHANEYFNYIDQHSKNNTNKFLVVFNVAVGSNYFFEIAKLRALRLLFETLKTEYTTNYNCEIFTTPSKRNKAIYDYNTNMLRTTTECMSAILGGANTIGNLPYNAMFSNDDEFGSRISRNQLLILKHESYFNAVDNPSDGSYYIETLTQQLAERALTLFKHIEANGGFLKQLKDGTIQRKIKESGNKEQAQFNAGEKVILGSNKHPNPNDKMKENLNRYPFVKHQKRKALIVPIIEKRLTENLEQERLKKE